MHNMSFSMATKQSPYGSLYHTCRIIGIILLLIVVCVSVLHVMCLLCVIVQKALHTTFNLILVSMPIADIILSSVVAPNFLYRMINERGYSMSWCRVVVGVQVIATFVNIFTMIVVAAVRCIHTMQITTRFMITKTHVLVGHVVVVVVCVLLTPALTQPHKITMQICTNLKTHELITTNIYVFTVVRFLCFLIVVVCYVAIITKVHMTHRRVSSQPITSILNVTAVTVTIVSYLISQMPLFIFLQLFPYNEVPAEAFFALAPLETGISLSHTIITPLVYYYGSTMFRKEFRCFYQKYIKAIFVRKNQIEPVIVHQYNGINPAASEHITLNYQGSTLTPVSA